MTRLATGRRRPARLALGLLTALGLAALAVTVVSTLMAVATRFLGLTGFEWSYEVAGIGFVWTTFAGAALAETRRENAAFDVLRAMAPARVRSALDRLAALLLLAVGGALAASGIADIVRFGLVPTPLLRWPGGIQIAAAPVLGLCLCVVALLRLVGRAPPRHPPTALADDGTGTPL